MQIDNIKFKFPIFMKFHKNGNQNITSPKQQYDFWTSVFGNSDINIISEEHNLINFCKHKIFPKISDYNNSWQQTVLEKISDNWKRHCEANLTPTKLTNEEYYWIIDADDLMFVCEDNKDLEKIQKSLLELEKIVEQENLDFCSLDINYTFHSYILKNTPQNLNWGHSCFGVVLIKNSNFYSLDNIQQEIFGINHDLLLEISHHRNKKSKVFCITDIRFQQYWLNNLQHDLLFSEGSLNGSILSWIPILQKNYINNVPIKSQIIF